MQKAIVAGTVSLLLSSFAWAQGVTFDFEHLPLGEFPDGNVVIARTLPAGDLIPGYDPLNPPPEDHIAIRVSRAGVSPRIDQLSEVEGRPPEWGSRTLSPFADPLNPSRMVIEILHVPAGQGVESIQWDMGDFIPSDTDEYEFQTFVDVPAGTPPPVPPGSWTFVFTRALDALDEISSLPPTQQFFAVTKVTQRTHPITRFEIVGGSMDDPLNLGWPIYPHSVYYDNFVLTVSPVDPISNGFVEGTDVPESDFGGDTLSVGLDGAGDDPFQNSPPTANAGSGAVHELGADIVLAGTVADLDGGDLTYEWVLVGADGDEVLGSGIVTALPAGEDTPVPDVTISSCDLGVAIHTIELRVVDEYMAEGMDAIQIEVVDTTPPTMAPVASRRVLFPPDRRMVPVWIKANAKDACGGKPTLSVVVYSDEPVGCGWFAPDWSHICIDQETGIIRLLLRAERMWTGDGRTYTVEITATDGHGNSSIANVKISVPHHFRNRWWWCRRW